MRIGGPDRSRARGGGLCRDRAEMCVGAPERSRFAWRRPVPRRAEMRIGGIMIVMASATTSDRALRLRAARREGERVTPLELFFDLVFVLALTQCTALMSNRSTWGGLAQGLLVLAVLWWSWVGYAWLTSVVDPEEGTVRIAIFVAMAAFLIAAIAVPEAFDDLGLAFALAYAVVRAAHIALFVLASRDDPALRQSVLGLAGSTAIGVSLLVAASFLDGLEQGALWGLALALDMGGPYFFGAEGWRLFPGTSPSATG